MAQKLRESTDLPGDLSLVPITHIRWFITAYSSSSRKSVMLASAGFFRYPWHVISTHYLWLLLLLWLVYPERMTKRNKAKKGSYIRHGLWSCAERPDLHSALSGKDKGELGSRDWSVKCFQERTGTVFLLSLTSSLPWLVLKDPRRHTDMLIFFCSSSSLEMQHIGNRHDNNQIIVWVECRHEWFSLHYGSALRHLRSVG